VTGKPVSTVLPPPFAQVPRIGSDHQVHHKFAVCGFNRDDATVFCGSSNLATASEEDNGDNLLRIENQEVATAFALEAIGLVDHFNFLDKLATGGKGQTAKATGQPPAPAADPPQAAAEAGWFLSADDGWTAPYFDSADLKCADRQLFGALSQLVAPAS
jgi:phosphatidylserine/phosphatidylglycerophosphate/cardiolipin synthase-like enzyme